MECDDKHILFQLLSTELAIYLHNIQTQAERNILIFPANQIDRLGQVLFSNLKIGGFCTFVVNGRATWNPKSLYFEASRFAAKRGCKIERAFLLPQKNFRHNSLLREHKELDDAAGIITHVLYIGELISNFSLPYSDSLDFGIWDDTMSCIAIHGFPNMPSGISEWRISTRQEDLQLLNDIISVLRQEAPKLSLDEDEISSSLDLEEPMLITAPIAHEVGSVLCKGDHVSYEDCSWYHSIWQYMRIFNMVSTPTWHADFYFDSLGELSKSSNYKHILITGT